MRMAAICAGFSVLFFLCQFSFGKNSAEATYWLVQHKCTVCHDTDRIKSARHTPEEWTSTVNRMRLKNPENIGPEESREIAGYLAEIYPKSVASHAATEEEEEMGKFLGLLALASLALSFGLGIVMMRGRRYLFRWHRLFGYATMALALVHGVYIFIYL